jgi:hypothetical protein
VIPPTVNPYVFNSGPPIALVRVLLLNSFTTCCDAQARRGWRDGGSERQVRSR